MPRLAYSVNFSIGSTGADADADAIVFILIIML